MKIRLLILALIPLMFLGCDDLFDKGDTEKVYDGPTVVGFFPLEREVSEIDGTTTLEIQLIGEQRTSAVTVTIEVDDASTAEAGVHYNLPQTEVTIEPGTSTVDVPVEIIDSGLISGSNVRLRLNITGASGDVEPSANLVQSSIFITRFDRAIQLQNQALDLRGSNRNLLATNITGQAGDVVVITPYVESGDYEGAPIVGVATLDANLRSGSIPVNVDGATPIDHAAHIIRGSQVSEATLDTGEISEETVGFVVATSGGAAIYAVNQFAMSDQTYPDSTNTVLVDLVEILYDGSLGPDLISLDLHAVDAEGNIGAFVGISQQDLEVNLVHTAVLIDVVEAVDPDDDEKERVEDYITETATFFAMAHLGAAGLDEEDGRIPATRSALRTTAEADGSFVFFPIGDDAAITILDDD
jgi:hypothetical protein